jgi:hypothetical protein
VQNLLQRLIYKKVFVFLSRFVRVRLQSKQKVQTLYDPPPQKNSSKFNMGIKNREFDADFGSVGKGAKNQCEKSY